MRNPNLDRAWAALREVGVEHAVTDDELQWIMANPEAALERSRRIAELAADVSERMFERFARCLERGTL